ncbi:MAG: hypothetical protein KDA89_25285, partial [Planctomycetaceae bacterium]|nr:hypothetical protein [Planctomycetaceae bacterium]
SDLSDIDAQAQAAAAADPITIQQSSAAGPGSLSIPGLAMIDLGWIWNNLDEGVQEFIVGGTAGAATGAVVGAGTAVFTGGLTAVPGFALGAVVGFIGGGVASWWTDPDQNEANFKNAVVSGATGGATASFFVVGLIPTGGSGVAFQAAKNAGLRQKVQVYIQWVARVGRK